MGMSLPIHKITCNLKSIFTPIRSSMSLPAMMLYWHVGEWKTSAFTCLMHWFPNLGNFSCWMSTDVVVENTPLVVVVCFGFPIAEIAPCGRLVCFIMAWELPESSRTIIGLVGNLPPILFAVVYTISERSVLGLLFWLYCLISNFFLFCILVATRISPRFCMCVIPATSLGWLLP